MILSHVSGARNVNKNILHLKYSTRQGFKWLLRLNAFGHLVLFCLVTLAVLRINARPNCQATEMSGGNDITCDIIRDILDTHNRIRQSIAEGSINAQPPAANMRQLHWDSQLASDAQNWANQCTFKHNDPKNREVARFQVGQNIGLMKSSRKNSDAKKIDFPKQIHKWFDEHNAYQFGAIQEEVLPMIGHYTQLAWANTYLVGCGYFRYKISNTTHRLYVCHYGPAGNEIGQLPYIVGNRSCDHSLEVSNEYSNLCSVKSVPVSCPENNSSEDIQKTAYFY